MLALLVFAVLSPPLPKGTYNIVETLTATADIPAAGVSKGDTLGVATGTLTVVGH